MVLSLKHVAFAFTKNWLDAEDLVNDLFLQAAQHVHKVADRDEKDIVRWLVVIMRNLFINQYRRSKRSPFIYSEWINEGFAGPDVYSKLKLKETLATLKDNIGADCLTLYASGYHYLEIVAITGLKEGTVKSQIHFARKAIKENK